MLCLEASSNCLARRTRAQAIYSAIGMFQFIQWQATRISRYYCNFSGILREQSCEGWHVWNGCARPPNNRASHMFVLPDTATLDSLTSSTLLERRSRQIRCVFLDSVVWKQIVVATCFAL